MKIAFLQLTTLTIFKRKRPIFPLLYFRRRLTVKSFLILLGLNVQFYFCSIFPVVRKDLTLRLQFRFFNHRKTPLIK